MKEEVSGGNGQYFISISFPFSLSISGFYYLHTTWWQFVLDCGVSTNCVLWIFTETININQHHCQCPTFNTHTTNSARREVVVASLTSPLTRTCTGLTDNQEQVDRRPLRIGCTAVTTHLVVWIFPETCCHLAAGQSTADRRGQTVQPDGQVLRRINRQAAGGGVGSKRIKKEERTRKENVLG